MESRCESTIQNTTCKQSLGLSKRNCSIIDGEHFCFASLMWKQKSFEKLFNNDSSCKSSIALLCFERIIVMYLFYSLMSLPKSFGKYLRMKFFFHKRKQCLLEIVYASCTLRVTKSKRLCWIVHV